MTWLRKKLRRIWDRLDFKAMKGCLWCRGLMRNVRPRLGRSADATGGRGMESFEKNSASRVNWARDFSKFDVFFILLCSQVTGIGPRQETSNNGGGVALWGQKLQIAAPFPFPCSVLCQISIGISGSWNGGTVPYKAIFCGDIPLHRPVYICSQDFGLHLQYYGNYNLSWFRPDLCTSQMDALNDTDLATFFGLDLGVKQKFDGERSMYNVHVIPNLGRVVEHPSDFGAKNVQKNIQNQRILVGGLAQVERRMSSDSDRMIQKYPTFSTVDCVMDLPAIWVFTMVTADHSWC